MLLIPLNLTKSWIGYIIFSIFIVALLLTFAEPAWAIQQKITEDQILKQVNDAYQQEKPSPAGENKITGMAGGGNAGGMIMLLIGIIMAVVAIVMMLAKLFASKSATCLATTPWLKWLCIGMLILGIIFILVGIMLMAKGKEAKSGEREEKDQWGSMQGGVEKQATTNQKTTSSSSKS